MNILNLNSYKPLTFTAGKKTAKKEPPYPEKMEFSETELAFKDYINRRNILERNIYTQKQNLRTYYSSQDRFEYKELLKEKQSLTGIIKRLGKKYGVDPVDIEWNILEKKDYNWFAPKVFRAKTQDELNKIKVMMQNAGLFSKAEKMLMQLIEYMEKNKIFK